MIRKIGIITLTSLFFFLLLHPEKIFADSKQVQLDIRAEVKNMSKLELDSATIIFDLGSLSPDDAPTVHSTPGLITLTCKARTGANTNVTLTILSTGDLVSGPDTISINNITWNAAGSGFTAGTMDKASPQSLGSWIGSGVRSGGISFRLINRWEYAKADYGTTALLILTAP